jgi:hypothetical protein
MSGSDKVLLLELRERTSAKGTRYLSGWLGKAGVVAFLDREAAEPTWQVFVSTPAPRSNDGPSRPTEQSPFTPRRRQQRGHSRPMQPGELDDRVDDLGKAT